MILERFVERFTESSTDKLYRQQREKGLKNLNRWASEQALGYYAKEIRPPKDIAELTNRFIEERARRDLPRWQFRPGAYILPNLDADTLARIDEQMLRDNVEIAGILGFNDGLHEISYIPPQYSKVTIQRDDNGFISYVGASTFLNLGSSMAHQDFDKLNPLIFWHSHPSGWGDLSDGDLKSFIAYNKAMNEQKKKCYEIIFLPAINKSIWYEILKD